LVPLFHEGDVVDRLVGHLAQLDYPPEKLEILLLCEEEDGATIEAVCALRLPKQFKLIICPDGQPRTKPRACNIGLAHSTGGLCVIYDAEDRPALDQLRRAAELFAVSDEEVVCLQGSLDYHNHNFNWLTRFFTIEYNYWFDLLLPGLSLRDLPIPLGGTSNHFRAAMLRSLGGWDPFNVTEDADLGVRLYGEGLRTRMLRSVTLEEACSAVSPWIRQRSRWIKGYMQTWAVHMRRGSALRKRGGWKGVIGLHVLVGGTPLVNLINPVFWGMFVAFLIARPGWIEALFPGPLLYLAVTTLAVGNFLFTYVSIVSVVHRRRWHLIHAALLTPIYWSLMSIATWRAVVQLVFRPHFWEKTPHGLSGNDTDPAHGPQGAQLMEPVAHRRGPGISDLSEQPQVSSRVRS
jgi:cellulose synthase/poly-beta-1,6-N-acetylglucosamine synthase-like glycosyltransferase